MSSEMERVKRTIRWLQGYAAVMTIALVVLFVGNGTAADGVLRARGLIIEDDAGRERILIGAPIPEAGNRVRADTTRLRELWGPRHPNGACWAEPTMSTSFGASIRILERLSR